MKTQQNQKIVIGYSQDSHLTPIIYKITEKIEKNITIDLNISTIKSKLHIFYLSDDIPSLKYVNNKIEKAKKPAAIGAMYRKAEWSPSQPRSIKKVSPPIKKQAGRIQISRVAMANGTPPRL